MCEKKIIFYFILFYNFYAGSLSPFLSSRELSLLVNSPKCPFLVSKMDD
jgi:hypothetical protein